MKVYLVTSGRYDDFQICSAHLDRVSAILRVLKGDGDDIETLEVDETESQEPQYNLFVANPSGPSSEPISLTELVDRFDLDSARRGNGWSANGAFSIKSLKEADDLFAQKRGWETRMAEDRRQFAELIKNSIEKQ